MRKVLHIIYFQPDSESSSPFWRPKSLPKLTTASESRVSLLFSAEEFNLIPNDGLPCLTREGGILELVLLLRFKDQSCTSL